LRFSLDAGAAALNQKSEHEDKQDARHNPNNHDTIHVVSSFLNEEVL
jgi:hypothetical protein